MNLNGNYIDLFIVLVLVYFASEAWRHGFWVLLADFISFLGSLLLSLRVYKFASELLRANFSLSHSFSNAVGFLITAIVLEAFLGFLFGHLIGRLPEKLWKHKLNKLLGIIPGLGEGLVLIAFVLTLGLGLPIKPSVKADIVDSKIGGYILKQTSGVQKAATEIFGGVIEDSLTYLTVKPGSRERLPLTVEKQKLSVDEKAEAEMFKLVNGERRKIGTAELIWSPEIVPIARMHAKDMWERKYFGHVSPEGKDVGNRLDEAKVSYDIAGENLALAPTVSTSHTGLMNSEGHRANILDPKFKKVGIGVIDNGYYGKLFVEVFTD